MSGISFSPEKFCHATRELSSSTLEQLKSWKGRAVSWIQNCQDSIVRISNLTKLYFIRWRDPSVRNQAIYQIFKALGNNSIGDPKAISKLFDGRLARYQFDLARQETIELIKPVLAHIKDLNNISVVVDYLEPMRDQNEKKEFIQTLVLFFQSHTLENTSERIFAAIRKLPFADRAKTFAPLKELFYYDEQNVDWDIRNQHSHFVFNLFNLLDTLPQESLADSIPLLASLFKLKNNVEVNHLYHSAAACEDEQKVPMMKLYASLLDGIDDPKQREAVVKEIHQKGLRCSTIVDLLKNLEEQSNQKISGDLKYSIISFAFSRLEKNDLSILIENCLSSKAQNPLDVLKFGSTLLDKITSTEECAEVLTAFLEIEPTERAQTVTFFSHTSDVKVNGFKRAAILRALKHFPKERRGRCCYDLHALFDGIEDRSIHQSMTSILQGKEPTQAASFLFHASFLGLITGGVDRLAVLEALSTMENDEIGDLIWQLSRPFYYESSDPFLSSDLRVSLFASRLENLHLDQSETHFNRKRKALFKEINHLLSLENAEARFLTMADDEELADFLVSYHPNWVLESLKIWKGALSERAKRNLLPLFSPNEIETLVKGASAEVKQSYLAREIVLDDDYPQPLERVLRNGIQDNLSSLRWAETRGVGDLDLIFAQKLDELNPEELRTPALDQAADAEALTQVASLERCNDFCVKGIEKFLSEIHPFSLAVAANEPKLLPLLVPYLRMMSEDKLAVILPLLSTSDYVAFLDKFKADHGKLIFFLQFGTLEQKMNYFYLLSKRFYTENFPMKTSYDTVRMLGKALTGNVDDSNSEFLRDVSAFISEHHVLAMRS